jgi:translation initiation factor 3 subunit B
LRSFAGSEVNDIFVWPYLQWSHDDKYVAKMKTGPQGCISVYEAETMGLLDKKSIKIENLLGFCWSPSDNYITYWTPELGNIPARVTLLNIPNRHIIRTKNFFNVLDVIMF